MNLVGKRFGKLEVIGASSRKGYVICKCDCGNNHHEVRATSLTKKKYPTNSCGCIQKKVAKNTGEQTVHKNAEQWLDTNRKFNTNFHTIESEHLPKNNSSGHKGVSWNNSRQRWESYISVHGKRIALGRYEKLEDAIQAREEAEELYFAPLIKQKRGET